jgi:hypothetical protein
MSEEHNKAGKRNNPGSSDGKPLGSILPVNQLSVTNKNYHPTPKDTPLEKTYTLQTHLVNRFVVRALEETIDFSASGDRFTNLLAKIQETKYTVVELSPLEVETLLEALLRDMSKYTSVTVKTYHLKEEIA